MPDKITISDLEPFAISGWKPNQPFNTVPTNETSLETIATPGWKSGSFNEIPSNVKSLEYVATPGWKSGSNEPFNLVPTTNETSLEKIATPGWKSGSFNLVPTTNETSLESVATPGWKSGSFNEIPSNVKSLESVATPPFWVSGSEGPFNDQPIKTTALEVSSSQLDILAWQKQKPITNETSLETIATPGWKSGSFSLEPTTNETSLEKIATPPFWVSGSNKPFNEVPSDESSLESVATNGWKSGSFSLEPTTNETSLEKDATPGWAKGEKKNVPGSPYGDPKLDGPAKFSNVSLLEFGIKTTINSALAPFGTSADNYVKFNIGDSTYDTTPWWSIGFIPLALLDFRASAGKALSGNLKSIATTRLDGASAALRSGVFGKAALYATLSATTGPYMVFGRSAPGKKGKGWGDHDSTTAPRLDFTARSSVNTTWDSSTTNSWIPSTSITERLTPFRGDKVTVIDFKQRSTLADTYQWKPTISSKIKVLGKFINAAANSAGKTSDFIKFYFTGPKILAGDNGEPDDIIAFRAIIERLTDSFNPQYAPVTMIGRADPNYHYSSFSREIGLDFTIYATDRDEMKPIYRKLNALAGYTAPTYSASSIGLTAPWMRITIGDLLVQQPVLISSLTYGLTDTDTTWEINIEDDPEMMQAPHRVTVSMGLTVIADWLPEKGGRFYSLAKRFDIDGIPIQGNDNWLSDFSGNTSEMQAKEKSLLVKNNILK